MTHYQYLLHFSKPLAYRKRSYKKLLLSSLTDRQIEKFIFYNIEISHPHLYRILDHSVTPSLINSQRFIKGRSDHKNEWNYRPKQWHTVLLFIKVEYLCFIVKIFIILSANVQPFVRIQKIRGVNGLVKLYLCIDRHRTKIIVLNYQYILLKSKFSEVTFKYEKQLITCTSTFSCEN